MDFRPIICYLAGQPVLQAPTPAIVPAQPPPMIAVSHSEHCWLGDRFGRHLSVSVMGILNPCPELARHSVLSFAVSSGDVAAFLQSHQLVHASAIDWFDTAQGPRRTARGRHPVGGAGSNLYKETVWTAPPTSSMRLTLTQTLTLTLTLTLTPTLALTLALTLTRCGLPPPPRPHGSRRGPSYTCAWGP